MEKYINGTYEIEDEKDDVYEGENKEEEEEEEEEETKGFTIKNCAALLKDDYAFKNIKPRRIKQINEEKYFNAISKMQPKYLLKAEQMNEFFEEKVGNPRSHYRDLISKINE